MSAINFLDCSTRTWDLHLLYFYLQIAVFHWTAAENAVTAGNMLVRSVFLEGGY